jgi:hypothetical protein
MAPTRTGIAIEFESRGALRTHDRRHSCARYPKPGLSREAFLSLLMCFPITCMLWAAIIYGAFRLAQ